MYSTSLLNFLTADRTILTFDSLPELSLTIQTYNIPGVSLNSPNQATPLVNIPLIGDKITNDEMAVTFAVDAGLTNWLSVRNWIISNADPKQRVGIKPEMVYTDAVITAYDSINQVIGHMRLVNCVPTALDGISSTTLMSETTTVTSTLMFKFERMDIEML